MEILNKIQKELKAPKGQRNTFGNYNYRSCEDILEAVKPLLGTATLILNDEIVLIGDRHYVKAIATISDGKESVSVSAYAREALEKKGMDVAQITGAASSYARKYALSGLFAIDDTKDADANGKPADFPENISAEDIEFINKNITELNIERQKFCDFMKVDAVENLLKTEMPKVKAAFEAKRKKGAK